VVQKSVADAQLPMVVEHGETDPEPDYHEGASTEAVDNIPMVGQPTPTAGAPAPLAVQEQQVAQTQEQGVMGIPQPVGLPVQQGQPQAQVGAPSLTNYGLTADQKKTFIRALLLRLYDGMFTNCGYQYNQQANPAEAFPGFTNPNAVFGFIPVSDIPYAKEMLTGVKTTDEQSGKQITVDIWNPQVAGWPAGHVRGVVWSKGQFTSVCPIPGYILQLNMDGMPEERTFMPQNANTRYPDGNLKDWAKKARAGNMIALLLNDKAGQNNKIQIQILTTLDGSTLREVMAQPITDKIILT
jgi:hypothetical protein